VAIRAGHHCAQPLVNLLGVDALLRASFTAYNSQDDVKQLLAVLQEAIAFFSSAG